MKFKAVIFDFDDTVVRSGKDHIKSYIQVGKKFGFKIEKTKIGSMFGMPAHDIFGKLFPEFSKEKLLDLKKEKEKAYRKIVSKKKALPVTGIRNMVKFLEKNGIKTALVSSTAVRDVKLDSKRASIGEFQVVVGSEDVKKHKPDPQPLLLAARKLKMKPKDCIYIGDSIYDMMAAKRAKMMPVGIATGYYSKRKLREKGAKEAFENHNEIIKFLS